MVGAEDSAAVQYHVVAESSLVDHPVVPHAMATPHPMQVTLNATLLGGWNGSGVEGHPNSEQDFAQTETDCRLFLFILYVVVMGSMCVFGLIGNTLSFIVLQWEKQNYVATFLLQVMALFDNLFLLTTGYTTVFAAVMFFVEKPESHIAPYNVVYVWPLVHITQMGTVWITVLIAFNRYIAICKPFQAPMLCTISRVRLQCLAMTVCIILYNLPRFMENKVEYVTDPVTNITHAEGHETVLKQDPRYQIVYESLLYCLFVFLGPLVILIVLNTCLIQELMRARRRLLDRQLPAAMTGEDQENNLTLVMIVIVLVFLVCQTPAFLNQLLHFFLAEQHYQCGKAYFNYYHISNLMVTANSSLNFVVYCIFRKQFRERLWAFFHRQRHSLVMTDAYHCNGRTASIYSRNTNPVAL